MILNVYKILSNKTFNEYNQNIFNYICLCFTVQTTFGAIVKREISVVAEKQTRSKWSDIEATFRRVNASRSMVSCSTVSASSESNFVSSPAFL